MIILRGLQGFRKWWVGKNGSVINYSTSPSGKIFNFANSGSTAPAAEPIYFLFQSGFQPAGSSGILSGYLVKDGTERNYFRFYFLSIPWYDTASSPADALPKLKVYEGINDIIVFNGNRNIPNSLYLIAKTGDPDMAHQQLDIGTFIIETNGIRWTDDLGSDNYGLPGFWDYKPDGQRWTYFRNSNFSHNTLSIDHRLQNSAGTGEIDRLDNKAAQPFVTMDMSTTYAGQKSFCLSDIPYARRCPYTGYGQHRVTEPASVGTMVRNNFGKRRMQRKYCRSQERR